MTLAVVGVGQGLFISPNSSAIMTFAPAELTAEAGSVLNLMRFLGISTGIVGGLALLALRQSAVTGADGQHTVDVAAPALISAGRDIIVLLCYFAVLAGILSLMRTAKRG